jgi:hypothetical protein
MPSFTITDPTSGKKVTLTGDSPPSELELNHIFSKIPGGTPWQPKKEDFQQFATEEATRQGLDPSLLHRVIATESNWDKNAISPKGAIGLGQLMPGTAKELQVDPTDPFDNIRGAAKYLKKQLDTFKTPELALQAYNAGPGSVRSGKASGYGETQKYVQRVLGDRLGGAVNRAAEDVAGELPNNPVLSKEYWTENVPRSASRLIPSLAYGAGKMVYDAAKTFTDPVVNAVSGRQSLGDAASDLFNAPSTAGRNALVGMGEAIAAPVGLMGQEAFNRSWNDPAASLAAIAPLKMAVVPTARQMLAAPVERAAAKLTDMTLKQPTTLTPNKRAQNVQTALEGDYRPTADGVGKLNSDIKANEGRIASGIANGDAASVAGTLDRAIANVESLRDKARRSDNPGSNMALVDAEIERLRNSPMVVDGGIPISEMQRMKVDQGRAIAEKYGKEAPSFQDEINKARVRGLKEELEVRLSETFPELANINKKLGTQYQLSKVLERAASRIQNREGIGIAPVIKSGAGAGLGSVFGPEGAAVGGAIGTIIGIIEHPSVAPALAQMLYKATGGKMTLKQASEATNARIASVIKGVQKETELWNKRKMPDAELEVLPNAND